jgi:hypothetical protein
MVRGLPLPEAKQLARFLILIDGHALAVRPFADTPGNCLRKPLTYSVAVGKLRVLGDTA